MKLIVISNPEYRLKEVEHIQHLFNLGLETLHLRKHGLSEHDFEKSLRELNPSSYKKIVIHSHYKLIEKYNLKGIHLTEWFIQQAPVNELKQVISAAKNRGLSVSGSFHRVADLKILQLKLDYVFLGPVYDSISKQGHKASINIEEASEFLKQQRAFQVIALGGVDEKNISALKIKGFDGIALLGSIWNDNDPSSNFQKIKNCLTNG